MKKEETNDQEKKKEGFQIRINKFGQVELNQEMINIKQEEAEKRRTAVR